MAENKRRARPKSQEGFFRRLFPKYENTSVDLTFLVMVMLLLVFGLVMMFSASYAQGYYREGNSFHYIVRQLAWAALGLLAMFVFSRMDYHIWRKLAWLLFPVVVILLVLCFFMPPVNDAHRWIFIGSFQFQPSELAKFSLVLLFAHLLTSNEKKMGKLKYGVLPFGFILIVYVGLVIFEPHLSAAILLTMMGVIMMIVGGLPAKWIAAGAGLLAGAVGIVAAVPMLRDRFMDRFTIWLNPESDPLGKGYQILQSLYAIGSGGLMGSGIGNSHQKYLFLPEPQNDYVFSVLCEELGFVGALVVILLFALLIWRGFTIVIKSRDRFGAMLVTGFIAQVGVQAILNMAVVTNALPSTGISLPFFSYGGTALAILLGEMGIVLSVSRQSTVEKE